MLLSDLLGSAVRTPEGRMLGRIVDIRFRREPRQGAHEGTLQLIALIASPRTRLSFYGYERGRVDRPAVVAAVLRWLHRGSRVIPWECVQRVEHDVVVLNCDPPVIPLDVRIPVDSRRSRR